mmetsp:Transcript_1604/g.2487  ORF Transcript_1604/g.2487 Transcript_1604/m.2487 type:complete len:116 (+) Transcript_1604:1092-1439(+)
MTNCIHLGNEPNCLRKERTILLTCSARKRSNKINAKYSLREPQERVCHQCPINDYHLQSPVTTRQACCLLVHIGFANQLVDMLGYLGFAKQVRDRLTWILLSLHHQLSPASAHQA